MYLWIQGKEGSAMGRLISLAELASRTGTCENTWRRAVARGEIPVVRIGRAIRVAEAEVERILRDGKRVKHAAEHVPAAV